MIIGANNDYWGHSLPLSSLLKQHFNPYKMSLTMILNDIPCVKLSLKPLPNIIVLDIGFMRSSNLKALTKTVITYRFVFDIIKCHVWF